LPRKISRWMHSKFPQQLGSASLLKTRIRSTEIEEIDTPNAAYRGPPGFDYEYGIKTLRIKGPWQPKIA